jgi:hypothetical protein
MFRSLVCEGYPQEPAQHDYVEHIWKRSGTRMMQGLATDGHKMGLIDYVASAVELAESLKTRNFWPEYAIPVDSHGEILNGAHRVACALALGKNVIIGRAEKDAWAPPWDGQWFVDNGFGSLFAAIARAEMGELINGRTADSGGHAGCGEHPRKTA